MSKYILLGSIVNASVVVTSQGAVVIDTSNTPEGAQEVFAQASAHGPVLYVVNTHEHVDHLAGNHLFACPKISSTEAREQMLRDGNVSPAALPTLTFDRGLTLHVGEPIHLLHMGGHCPGASVVYLPLSRTLFVGDLVFSGRVPYMGAADLGRWIMILRELETWDAEIVVPGHGVAGGKELLTAQRAWLEKFVADVQDLSHAGESNDAILTEMLNRYTVIERWHPMIKKAIELALVV